MTTAEKLFKLHTDLSQVIMTENAEISPALLARLEDAEEIINDVRNELASTTP